LPGGMRLAAEGGTPAVCWGSMPAGRQPWEFGMKTFG